MTTGLVSCQTSGYVPHDKTVTVKRAPSGWEEFTYNAHVLLLL